MKYSRIILLWLALYVLSCESSTKRFNSEEWKNWKETESTLYDRWDMATDLVRTDELMMFDKKEIIELLGEPNTSHPSQIMYFVGHSRTGINTGQLIIEFDKNNHASDFILVEG